MGREGERGSRIRLGGLGEGARNARDGYCFGRTLIKSESANDVRKNLRSRAVGPCRSPETKAAAAAEEYQLVQPLRKKIHARPNLILTNLRLSFRKSSRN